MTQETAIVTAIRAVYETVKGMGQDGCPAGPLYAGLMAHGCTMTQFESLMSALVETGKVRKDGHVYYAS